MQTLIIILFAILGLIIGSFLNVVVIRMHTGRGIGGRSHCMSCGKTLAWYEMIPVISYLVQRGKCRHCHSSISVQYPLVESATAILFAIVGGAYVHLLWVGLVVPFVITVLFWLIFISIAMVISVYDIRHRIVPIGALIALLILCLIGGIFGSMFFQWIIPAQLSFGLISVTMHVAGALIVPLPFLILWLVSRGKLIGFGDIEIMSGIGFLFGVTSGFSAVTLAFWIGTIFVMIAILVTALTSEKTKPMHAIAFAPFLFAGALLVGVLGLDIFAMILRMH